MAEEDEEGAHAPEPAPAPEPKNEVSELIAAGKSLHEEGEYAAAVAKFDEALALDPHSAEAHKRRGDALYWDYKYEEALAAYDRALAEDAESETRADAHYQRGEVLYGLRRFEESSRSYAEALPLFDALTAEAHAKLEHAEGRRLEGRASDAHNDLGYAFFALKNYDDARLQFEAASSKGRKYPYAYHNLASLFWAQGRYEEARECWEEARNRYDEEAIMDEARSLNWSGHFLYFANLLQEVYGELERAEGLYREVIRLLDGSATARVGLMGVYMERAARPELRAGSYHNAKQFYEQAKKILRERVDGTQDLDSMIALGELHIAWSDYDGSGRWREDEGNLAEQWLTEAFRKDEADAAAAEGYTRTAKPGANLGVVHARRKDYRKAAGFFERALMIESDDLTLRSNLAEAYLRDKRLEEAEREYLYILNMAPEHVESIIGLGELYLERGKGDTDMYLRAASKFAEVVGLARQRRGSKRLKDKELAKVHYLWGYALVQSFEGSKLVKDQSLLWDARREFKECVKCDPEHYQARRAAEKIEKGLGARSAQRLLEQLAPYLILAASFFVFGVAQWKYIYTADEKFGATEYAALTFGSLALIAAGAYLPQVLKLKFAGLELEKSNVDQLATLGPLGITEGGSSRSG